MSFSINSVTIAGNLTRNPELKVVGADKTVAHFSLAINRRYKGADGEQKEEVCFVECEAWGRTAEIVGQYMTKGSGCCIEGRLRMDSWTDKTDGKNRSRLKVVADQVHFVGGRPRDGEAGAAAGMADGERDEGGGTRPAARQYNSGARPGNPAMARREPNPVRQVRSPAGAGSAALGDDQPPF